MVRCGRGTGQKVVLCRMVCAIPEEAKAETQKKEKSMKVSIEEAKKYLSEKIKSDKPALVCRTTGEIAYITQKDIEDIDGTENFRWEIVQGCSDLEPTATILVFEVEKNIYVA